jgi:AAA+ ATPase superfamily predicted ATPase
MAKMSQVSQFWTYISECVRLLYWIYFKPYTFANWLRDIHPELKPNDNPFAKRVEFRTNPRLRRYAGQVWWLTVVVPLLAVLLVGVVYTVFSSEPFNWFHSCLFLLGWWIGLLLARGDNKKLERWERWFYRILLISTSVIFLWNVSFRLVPDIMRSLLQFLPFLTELLSALPQFWPLALGVAGGVTGDVAFGAALGVAGGVAEGVTYGVALGAAYGVTFGVTFGVAFGVAEGVAEGVAYGVAYGVAEGVAYGVAEGVAFGVAFGVALGVALGVAYILGILRVYFWLPELLWVLTLHFLTRQSNQARALRYLPSRFDQFIILPLPFMDELIVEAYRENPSAARETIDYLITSTNQQNVAAQAMVSIAIDSLNHCQKLGDIVDLTEELAWIPSPPPKDLGSALSHLLDISQGVRASVESTSLYRQLELLNRPISALRELPNTLAFGKNARLANTFGGIAQRWLTILERAQRTLQEQAQYSTEIRQVYIAGNALDPQTAKHRFKGRIDLFREIETLALAEPPPVLLLYGGRRTGKTSTLKYLPHKVGANFVPVLVDLQGAASAITLSGLAEELAKQVIEAARRLPRRLDLPYPDKNKLAQDPFPALQDWLRDIERTFPSKRFLLCLDEFERLSEVVQATGSRTPLNFLRNVLQHRASWTLLFSGSHEPKELPDYWSDYLINTRTLRVSYLDEDSARELIVQPVEDFPDIYSSTAVDAIIHLTRCQPYLVQLTCYEVVELLNRDIRENRRDASTAKATAQDVETVIPTVLERGGEYFRELWKSLTDSDRHLLRRLVQGETPIPQDKAVVRKLERKEILEKTESGYGFQVPLVQKYVEQVVEEEE